ncbi:MAG: hypothetical protein ACRD3M_01275, partial [Thermoanaerobaculia bacterium]
EDQQECESSGIDPMKRFHWFALYCLVLMMTWGATARGEDFYETRLRAGEEAYRAKRFLDAADELRIACFGFLERPPLLSEGLARLALAQAAAGRMADVDATLNRFIDIERRFATYGKLKLEPDIEADFRSLLLRRVKPETLLSLSSLAGLVETEEQKIGKLPPGQREEGLEAAMRREPKAVKWPLALARYAAERQDDAAVVKWAGRVLELEGNNAEAQALRAHARVRRRQYAEALADLKALPKKQWDQWPELYADELVCLVDAKDWGGAEQVVKLVPSHLMTRSDVAGAQRELAKEQGRREKENARQTTAIKESADPTETAVADERARREKATREEQAPAAGKAPRVEQPPPQEARATPSPKASAGQKPAAASSNAPGAAERSSPSAADILAESRRLLKAGQKGEAVRLVIEALKAEPARRDLRLVLLEAACLSGDWKTGAAQVPLVSPLREREGPSMFYAAVVLYESGRRDEARLYMEKAKSRIQSVPYVADYEKKILEK